jgi:hypothetical protein
MAEHKLERKVVTGMWARMKIPILCQCKQLMMVDNGGAEPRAICYNKTCDHYRVTFTVEYPILFMVQYADTVPIHDDNS